LAVSARGRRPARVPRQPRAGRLVAPRGGRVSRPRRDRRRALARPWR